MINSLLTYKTRCCTAPFDHVLAPKLGHNIDGDNYNILQVANKNGWTLINKISKHLSSGSIPVSRSELVAPSAFIRVEQMSCGVLTEEMRSREGRSPECNPRNRGLMMNRRCQNATASAQRQSKLTQLYMRPCHLSSSVVNLSILSGCWCKPHYEWESKSKHGSKKAK